MQNQKAIYFLFLISLLVNPLFSQNKMWQTDMQKPEGIYIAWGMHDELSNNVPLTEDRAMKELEAMIHLKKSRVQFDCFLMDMFWFDKNGVYREFKKEGWPNGPDK